MKIRHALLSVAGIAMGLPLPAGAQTRFEITGGAMRLFSESSSVAESMAVSLAAAADVALGGATGLRVGVASSVGDESVAIPGCIEGAPCEAVTLVPGTLHTAEVGISFATDGRNVVQFDAGPVAAWAPGIKGGNRASAGLGAGVTLALTRGAGVRPLVRLSAARLGTAIGVIRWYGVFRVGLTW